jgi:hypothetical protein
MDITRSARGDSLSQGLELGCYEPSAHDRQAFTDSAEVGGGRGPWKAMAVLISRARSTVMLSIGYLTKVERVACVWLVTCGW